MGIGGNNDTVVIDYKEYKMKLICKRTRYGKDKRLDFLIDKLYDWEIQEARKSSEDKIKFTFFD